MSLYDEMAESHRRDYRAHDRLRELRDVLEDFLADPPSRAHRQTQEKLREALASIRADMDHIVGVWD